MSSSPPEAIKSLSTDPQPNQSRPASPNSESSTSLSSWRRPLHSGSLFLLIFLLSAAYMAYELKHGWVPSDEGTFGQSAERILQGEIPHKDFDEGYTGGEAYLNAATFRLLGIKLVSLRYVLYLFFLLWVPALYLIFLRFASVPVASALTLLAVAWGPPIYTAPMPSWYNLFFATWGLGSLLRYLDTEKCRWLLLAGVCGGVSFLFKLSGLYFIAGALLFLVFREQLASDQSPSSGSRQSAYTVFALGSVLLYTAIVAALVKKASLSMVTLYLLIPDLAIAGLLVWHEFSAHSRKVGRFSFLFREVFVFTAGVVLPILVFLVPYALNGSLGSFAYGVFILPSTRFAHASLPPPRTHSILAVVACLSFVGILLVPNGTLRKILTVLAIVAAPAILLISIYKNGIYMAVWHTIWFSAPVVLVVGAAAIGRWSKRVGENPLQLQRMFLVISVTAACSLIQFPYTAPIYFCYIAPLVLLSATALINRMAHPPFLLLAVTGCFLFLYAVFEVTPGFVYNIGWQYSHDERTAALNLARVGGLRVFPESASVYERLGKIVGEHAHGDFIYATPDCPEVYFLYGFRNPTRTLFEFSDDPLGRTERILKSISDHRINMVVLNRRPQYSDPIPADLRNALEKEFPQAVTVQETFLRKFGTGDFEVRWKP